MVMLLKKQLKNAPEMLFYWFPSNQQKPSPDKYHLITTILAINCGKTIILDENPLSWAPLPPASMPFSAGSQQNKLEIGRGGQQMLGAFLPFCH